MDSPLHVWFGGRSDDIGKRWPQRPRWEALGTYTAADKGSDLGFFLKRVQKRLIITLIITYIGLIWSVLCYYHVQEALWIKTVFFYKVVNKGFKKSFFKSCVELQEKYLADKGSDLGFFLKSTKKAHYNTHISHILSLLKGTMLI